MVADACSLISVLVLSTLGLLWRWSRQRPPQPGNAAVGATVQRLLKPRTPDDCPACRRAALAPLETASFPPLVPWRERKRRRGAPKRIATEGFACPRSTCVYYQITDAPIHALVGDGTHGQHERIQTFRCQACKTTFSARRHTPLAPA
jgi:hypothetical protein